MHHCGGGAIGLPKNDLEGFFLHEVDATFPCKLLCECARSNCARCILAWKWVHSCKPRLNLQIDLAENNGLPSSHRARQKNTHRQKF